MRLLIVFFIWLLLSANVWCEPLRIATWGGDHGAVFKRYLVEPYSHTSRESLRIVESDGAFDAADVVEMELHDAIDACDRGRLYALPIGRLPFDSQKLIEDFVPNTLQPCAVGQTVWSTVAAFDKTRFRNLDQPALIGDFFNTDLYPGKRVLRRSPRALAEWVLAVKGIPVTDIYTVLQRTEFSWSLIEEALEDLGEDIVWVESDAEAMRLVDSGIAVFAMVHSDYAARHALTTNAEVGIIWDAAVAQMSVLAIPHSTSEFERAWKFLEFATSAEVSARFASHFGYAPARYSALNLMGSHLRPYLSGFSSNLATAIWGNTRWWRDRGMPITERFSTWLASRQLLAERRPMDLPFGLLAQMNGYGLARNTPGELPGP